MKTLGRLLKEFFLLQRFQIHAFLFLLIFSLTSCFQKFYATNSRGAASADTLRKLKSEGKIFIVHSADAAFLLNSPNVDGVSLSGYADSLAHQLKKNLNPEADSANRIHGQRELVFKQVHLYTDGVSNDQGKVSLNIDKIYRMDVYGPDELATKRSKTASIVGISIVAGVIISMGAYATSSIAF